MAPGVRIELTIAESKSVVLPLHYPGIKLERVARIELANKPWQGFRLPLHHTRMVLPRGIEPRSSDLQTGAMTTSAKAALVPLPRLERGTHSF